MAAFTKQTFTVLSNSDCANLCTTPTYPCANGETIADAITLNFDGAVSPPILIACTSSATASDMETLCENNCIEARREITTKKYNKDKLDPMSDAKYDTQDQTFSRSMCQALKVVTGSAGKTFAAFAIIATGIGFFTGKVSWGLMIGVTAGIATMFGAPSIVAAISGQDTTMSCDKIMPN